MVSNLLRSAVALGFVAIAGAASAATLITSDAGYTGPGLHIGSVGDPAFLFTGGPTVLPGGVTFTSTTSASVIGSGSYGIAGNGSSTGPIIGLNSSRATMTLTFDSALASFGLGMNYAPSFYGSPVIAAYDAGGGLIASYDLAALAPISTPGGINAFAFRGIDGGGAQIKSFTMSGAYIIASASREDPVIGGVVPEASTWAMLIVGFGFVGASMRNRRANRHIA